MSLKRKILILGLSFCFIASMALVIVANYKFEFNHCEIIRTATVINKAGSYCLSNDLKGSQTIIRIQQDHVHLDLRGHSLTGILDNQSKAVGIEINSGHDIQIMGGTVRGFFVGIRAELPVDPKVKPSFTNNGISVKNISIEDSSFRGIQITANNVSIENNLVLRTGGTTVFEDAYAIGIELSGFNARIDSNTVLDTLPVGIGEGVGISLSNYGENGVVKNNFIENKREVNQYGRSIGIWSGDTDHDSKPVFINNVVKNFMFPILFANSAFVSGNTFLQSHCVVKNKNSRYAREQPRNLDSFTQNYWMENLTNCTEVPGTYTKLALTGDDRAQFLLARIYRDGLLVPVDLIKSHHWLELAAKNGNGEAKRVFPFWIKEN